MTCFIWATGSNLADKGRAQCQDLPQWIAGTREAGLPGLASFAKGLEQDLGAVTLSGTRASTARFR